MPLYRVAESELRDACRRDLEALERWLRRLVHEGLTNAYGQDYLNAKKPKGDCVIRAEIARRIMSRAAQASQRPSRDIDSSDLDDLVDIICNPELYGAHFRNALVDAFPDGCAEARTFLGRLVVVRNALSHARPISIHEAHRVLCYSLDTIEALKAYYSRNSMEKLYNVPTVIRLTDSLGHEIFLADSQRRDHPAMLDFSRDSDSWLRCGDTISIEVDVDPSFAPDSYEVRWLIANIGGPTQFGRKFNLMLSEQYVSTRFCAVCYVTSRAAWHKFGNFDDQIDIAYRVLPPV